MTGTLRAFAETTLKSAQKIVRRGKTLVPVLIFDNGIEGGICAVAHYDRDREGARAAMKKMLIEKEAERYCFVMEAWFGAPPTNNDQNYRPSKDTKRRECITVSGQALGGEKVFLIVEIKRGKGGLVQFEQLSPDHGIATGPLLDLFELETRQ